MPKREDPYAEDGHRRRRAWERAKRAFGSEDVAEQLTRLERCRHACPQVLLAACVHRFLCLGPADRERTVHTYLASLAFPAAELIGGDRPDAAAARAAEEAFLAAMARVMGRGTGRDGAA